MGMRGMYLRWRGRMWCREADRIFCLEFWGLNDLKCWNCTWYTAVAMSVTFIIVEAETKREADSIAGKERGQGDGVAGWKDCVLKFPAV
jgi:hypothetical protein